LINRVGEKAQLEIHRYFPRQQLEGGVLGLLDFDRGRIGSLVERGFQDAVQHDCAANNCVMPVDVRQRRPGSTRRTAVSEDPNHGRVSRH
jgi:hypothetical protein